MEVQDIFDVMYERYKITKRIRLIEMFSGYGSQNLALKYLGADYEHYKICEWATKSIQAYNDLHIQDYNDYSVFYTYDEIVDFLYKKGISFDYKNSMPLEKIKKKREKWCRNVFNNILATNNLVNIQQAHASDLEIVDKDKYEYVLTYSFPCQDLSVQGLQKGMKKDGNTRSGLLWQIERILNECTSLPQILIMENVPTIHSIGNGNFDDFQDWIKALEKLGYKSYWDDLSATNYGIPQNRNRTIMVSILGDYNYKFPKPIELKYRIGHFLDKNINPKYAISEKMINGMKKTKFNTYKYENHLLNENSICPCIVALIDHAPILIMKNGREYKLSPSECFRLMGLKEEDIVKISKQVDGSLYHLAGDSIVVNVLMAVFKELIN